jgi:hypothetical protein
MTAQHPRSRSFLGRAAIIALVAGTFAPAASEGAVPAVQYVSMTSAYNSASPKLAIAQCPVGFVLGGAASISGAEGQVAIQAAFPMYDAGLAKYTFVVKAVEDLSGTAANWSVTASAYCTSSNAVVVETMPSAFNSDPIKSATVECPANMKVVGIGGEVSTADTEPAALVGTVPPAAVVFHGASANEDLTQVTVRATEIDAPFGGGFAAGWKVTAVVACAMPLYFDGLELRSNSGTAGGLLAGDTQSILSIACSTKTKMIISASSIINDHDMGQWYLDRFTRVNAFQNQIFAKADRNPELGTVLARHTALLVCVGN